MKHNKAITALTAFVLAAAMLLTGTFAWQSLWQHAVNEAQDGGTNPGARLHDDFDGSNKDVYVENFTNAANGRPVFVRVRLDEYMEFGDTAGVKGDAGNAVTPLVAGADIDNTDTWTTHIPGESVFSQYWHWDMGGSTVYMPTFNKNKDSVASDVNGTYAGSDPSDDIHFDDYVEYAIGQQQSGVAVYDNDSNSEDEGETAIEGANISLFDETHTACESLDATVLTMAEWKAAGSQRGNFWVGDTDGWYYWANPIQPGTATGKLLDGISLIKQPADTWYYGINVVGQFITADDSGFHDGTGFFTPEAPTEDALTLLEIIGVQVYYTGDIQVSAEDDTEELAPGASLRYTAKVLVDQDPMPDQTVSWLVAGNTSAETRIDPDGTLHVGADELASELRVIAVSEKYHLRGEGELRLLQNIAVSVSSAGDASQVNAGEQLQLAAAVTIEDTQENVDQRVTWSVSGNHASDTAVDENGLLTVGITETAGAITVSATSVAYGCAGHKDVTVIPDGGTVAVTTQGNVSTIKAGNDLPLSAVVTLNRESDVTKVDQTVRWTVSGNGSLNTVVNADGTLHVDYMESANTVTVTATSDSYAISGSKTISVTKSTAYNIRHTTPGSTSTVKIDNVDFYVLAIDEANNKALIMTKNPVKSGNSGAVDFQKAWKDNALRTWLNDTWLSGKTDLNAHLLTTSVKTETGFRSQSFTTTNDKVFLLTMQDVTGKYSSVAQQKEWTASNANCYTYNGKKLPVSSGMMQYGSRNGYFAMRSPSEYYKMDFWTFYSNLNNPFYDWVKPVMWYDLSH